MTDSIVTLVTDMSPSLPSNKGLFQRAAEFNFTAWFEANPALVTKDVGTGAVSSLAAKVGGAISYVQPTPAQQPIYTESQFGAFPGLKFDGVDDRLITAWTGAPNRAGPWSVALLCRLAAPAQQVTVMASRSGTNVGSLLTISNATNVMSFQHGTGVLAGPNLLTSLMYGKPLLAIFGSDTDNLFLRVNGRDYPSVQSNNAAATVDWVIGALNTAGGQPFNGAVATAIFAPYVMNNNAEVVDSIEAYAAKFMGVTMAWQS